MEAATEEFSEEITSKFTIKVLSLARKLVTDGTPTVEEIQDIVEEVLLTSPYKKTTKAYIHNPDVQCVSLMQLYFGRTPEMSYLRRKV